MRIAAFPLLLVAFAGVYAQQPLDIGHEERADLHVVMDWPFTVEAAGPRHAEACAALGAGDVEIQEDGIVVEVARIGPAEGRMTHLLLMDTSESMSGKHGILRRRLGQTKLAARHYVDLVSGGLVVREDDRLGLLTFDDDLLMHAPPRRIRDAGHLDELKQAIAAIEGGYDTAILDGLYRLVNLVDGLDERAVIIVISDGEDTASALDELDVRRLIARANNVTIFGIGIGLKGGPHRDMLRYLAEVTGGSYYDVLGLKDTAALSAGLRERFSDIHKRLVHQYYATYVTRRIAGPEAEGGRFVDVRIRVPTAGCVVSGYKRQRYAHGPERSDLQAGVHWQLRDEGAKTGIGVVRVGIRDFARDAGTLAVWGRDQAGGPQALPSMKDRTVELLVPPLEAAIGFGTLEVVDLVDGWLDTQLPDQAAGMVPASHLGPRTINGKAFLNNRDLLASAVFESFPAYRDWVRSALETELRKRFRGALPREYGDDQVELMVQARLERPPVEDLEQRLAAWLGDITTIDLAFRLERKWANLRADGRARGEHDLDHLRSRWRVLAEWLRAPDRARVFTPLLLSYDGDREVFGFHRIVLPRPRQLPRSTVPKLPLGLEIFDQLSVGDSACYRIESVEHHAMEPKELPPDAFPRGEQSKRVLHRLALAIDGPSCAAVDLDLVVEIADDGVTPFCVLAAESADPDGVERLLAGRAIPMCGSLAR